LQLPAQPAEQAAVVQHQGLELSAFLPGLLGITTIDQQRRAFLCQNRQPYAATETSQPVQSFVSRRQVFVEVSIATGK
jgi:hypothetical protein